jgi:hypothetical protein
MNNKIKIGLVVTLLSGYTAFAGNPDRAGGAGATQLVVNPYARSSGLGGIGTANVRGVESFYLNIGGLAYTTGTEVAFSRMNYFAGTGVSINNLGIAQALGEEGSGGVMGLGITSWDFGDIPITSFDNPDGTLPSYKPQLLNLNASYSKQFSNSITGGALLRIVSEGTADVRAAGVAMDFGVQYQTSFNAKMKKIKKEDFRLGISVRNIGPDLTYTGAGLSFRAINTSTGADRRALFDADYFNLPALVNIGLAYDMRLDQNDNTYYHRLTANGNFQYNAFQSNVLGLGAEYAYKEMFMLRGAYLIQEANSFKHNPSNPNNLASDYGFWGGLTLQMPISKKGTAFALDYSYAPTRIFNGMHTVGIRLTLSGK